MFNNSKSEQAVKKVNIHKVDTLIGPSASLQGDITSEGDVRVDGNFNGNILCKREVIIGETAVMTGNITADTVIIFGKVKGNIKSSGLLEIMSTGKLYGDIDVKSVAIKEGAVFKGKSIMNSDEKESLVEKEAAAGV